MLVDFSISPLQALLKFLPIHTAETSVTVDDEVILKAVDVIMTMYVANESNYFQAHPTHHLRGHNTTEKKYGHQETHEFSAEELISLEYRAASSIYLTGIKLEDILMEESTSG